MQRLVAFIGTNKDSSSQLCLLLQIRFCWSDEGVIHLDNTNQEQTISNILKSTSDNGTANEIIENNSVEKPINGELFKNNATTQSVIDDVSLLSFRSELEKSTKNSTFSKSIGIINIDNENANSKESVDTVSEGSSTIINDNKSDHISTFAEKDISDIVNDTKIHKPPDFKGKLKRFDLTDYEGRPLKIKESSGKKSFKIDVVLEDGKDEINNETTTEIHENYKTASLGEKKDKSNEQVNVQVTEELSKSIIEKEDNGIFTSSANSVDGKQFQIDESKFESTSAENNDNNKNNRTGKYSIHNFSKTWIPTDRYKYNTDTSPNLQPEKPIYDPENDIDSKTENTLDPRLSTAQRRPQGFTKTTESPIEMEVLRRIVQSSPRISTNADFKKKIVSSVTESPVNIYSTSSNNNEIFRKTPVKSTTTSARRRVSPANNFVQPLPTSSTVWALAALKSPNGDKIQKRTNYENAKKNATVEIGRKSTTIKPFVSWSTRLHKPTTEEPIGTDNSKLANGGEESEDTISYVSELEHVVVNNTRIVFKNDIKTEFPQILKETFSLDSKNDRNHSNMIHDTNDDSVSEVNNTSDKRNEMNTIKAIIVDFQLNDNNTESFLGTINEQVKIKIDQVNDTSAEVYNVISQVHKNEKTDKQDNETISDITELPITTIGSEKETTVISESQEQVMNNATITSGWSDTEDRQDNITVTNHFTSNLVYHTNDIYDTSTDKEDIFDVDGNKIGEPEYPHVGGSSNSRNNFSAVNMPNSTSDSVLMHEIDSMEKEKFSSGHNFLDTDVAAKNISNLVPVTVSYINSTQSGLSVDGGISSNVSPNSHHIDTEMEKDYLQKSGTHVTLYNNTDDSSEFKWVAKKSNMSTTSSNIYQTTSNPHVFQYETTTENQFNNFSSEWLSPFDRNITILSNTSSTLQPQNVTTVVSSTVKYKIVSTDKTHLEITTLPIPIDVLEKIRFGANTSLIITNSSSSESSSSRPSSSSTTAFTTTTTSTTSTTTPTTITAGTTPKTTTAGTFPTTLTITTNATKTHIKFSNSNITFTTVKPTTFMNPIISVITSTSIVPAVSKKIMSSTSTTESASSTKSSDTTVADEKQNTSFAVHNPSTVPAYLILIFKTSTANICDSYSMLKESLFQFITRRSFKVQSRDQITIVIDPKQCVKPDDLPRLVPVILYMVDDVGSYDRTLITELKTLLEKENANFTSPIHEIVYRENITENARTIGIAVVTSIAIISFIVLIFLMCMVRKKQKVSYGQRCTPVSIDDFSLDNISVYNSVRRKGFLRASKRSYGNPAFDDTDGPSKPVNYNALLKAVENRLSLDEEFSEIPVITVKPEELQPGAETKNRYANVIPLPETRVSLSNSQNNVESVRDYINANYIKGSSSTSMDRFYIACQAPLQSTIEDFWKMIWNEQSKVIIMLTGLVENGIEKCADYLPPSEVLDCHRLFGDFQVTLKKRESRDKYIVSSLQLKNMESNLWREVTHLWYTNWPTQGVPSEQSSIIALLTEARLYMRNNPSPHVVHCSPGTGRTGTIIACDICMRDYDATKTVNIPKVVSMLRRCRAGMVQTKDQYAFVYKVVAYYAKRLNGSASLESM